MKTILLIITLFFSACSLKNYEHTQSKILIIKSPKIKFADLGYVRNSEKSIELELFVAGQCVQKITINHLICVDDGCMSKSGFNSEYLHSSYPNDVLQNILLGMPIYEAKNRVQMTDGFAQKIQNEEVDIEYTVFPHAISFKDRKNNILVKIKDTK